MINLKVTFFQQLLALKSLIFYLLLLILLYLYIYFNYDIFFFKIIFYSLSGFFLLFYFLPVIILHINYLTNGVKQIKLSHNKIIIDNELFNSDSIAKIDIYKCRSGGIVFPYADYYYAVITLNNNYVYILNSLLSDKLDEYLNENFPNLKINKNISLYPYI